VFIGRAPVPAESFRQSLCETRSDADRLTIRRRRPAGHPASRMPSATSASAGARNVSRSQLRVPVRDLARWV